MADVEASILLGNRTTFSILPPSSACVGRGTGIANGIAIVVPRSLSEDAAELHLAGVCGLPVDLAGSTLGFFFDDGNAGAIHLYMENRNRFSHDHRQIQLHSVVDRRVLAQGDVAADRFGSTFDGFGRYLKTGEEFDLLPNVIEWRFGTNQRQHAPHPGGQVRFLDIQGGIGGELPRPHLAVMGFVAAWTGEFPLSVPGGPQRSN